jgi:surfeit locus 1 family protein
MLKALFSRRYILVTLLVLAAMAVMMRLGVWQLERREQRLARNADLVAKLEAAPLSLNTAVAAWPLPSDRDVIRNTRASGTGQFDFTRQLVLLQQPREGQLGLHLVAPLVLDGTGQAILVDRGWVPGDNLETASMPQYDEVAVTVTVEGFLQPSQILFGQAAERARANPEPQTPKAEWYRIDVEAIQEQMPYQLLPVYLLQSPDPTGNTGLPYRIEPEVDLSEGPHLGYALQWFAFAITAGVIYLSLVRSRLRKAATDTAAVAIVDDGTGAEAAVPAVHQGNGTWQAASGK